MLAGCQLEPRLGDPHLKGPGGSFRDCPSAHGLWITGNASSIPRGFNHDSTGGRQERSRDSPSCPGWQLSNLS